MFVFNMYLQCTALPVTENDGKNKLIILLIVFAKFDSQSLLRRPKKKPTRRDLNRMKKLSPKHFAAKGKSFYEKCYLNIR